MMLVLLFLRAASVCLAVRASYLLHRKTLQIPLFLFWHSHRHWRSDIDSIIAGFNIARTIKVQNTSVLIMMRILKIMVHDSWHLLLFSTRRRGWGRRRERRWTRTSWCWRRRQRTRRTTRRGSRTMPLLSFFQTLVIQAPSTLIWYIWPPDIFSFIILVKIWWVTVVSQPSEQRLSSLTMFQLTKSASRQDFSLTTWWLKTKDENDDHSQVD